ncbi:Rhodanese-like domain-containing protein 9 protein [Thalictrum thalictroides]|uniref:Rhodanese-like domain-containing protein 9 protein n=1 Tax=Thalictrum thalictroides TaxID=46969 RepID=A0A7J6VCE3_THATH|nr:Rhodanese-like domain-containing protein 9 protein [Thalictrum thalictroides]
MTVRLALVHGAPGGWKLSVLAAAKKRMEIILTKIVGQNRSSESEEMHKNMPNRLEFEIMAGLSFCAALSHRRKPWLVLETAGPCKSLRSRGSVIRAEIKFVNADEAKELIATEGYAVLDVRDKSQFERAHIKSCHHVPIYVENTDNDIGTIINRTLHNNFSGLFYGLSFTKPNDEFVQSVKSQFSPDSKLLIVCQEGLRSASAANKLEQAGFENISCMTSGLRSVKPGTFDSVGSTELQDAGKAGLVTVQGKISAVLGTVLVCAYLFIQFFPDQAEKILQMVPAS